MTVQSNRYKFVESMEESFIQQINNSYVWMMMMMDLLFLMKSLMHNLITADKISKQNKLKEPRRG